MTMTPNTVSPHGQPAGAFVPAPDRQEIGSMALVGAPTLPDDIRMLPSEAGAADAIDPDPTPVDGTVRPGRVARVMARMDLLSNVVYTAATGAGSDEPGEVVPQSPGDPSMAGRFVTQAPLHIVRDPGSPRAS